MKNIFNSIRLTKPKSNLFDLTHDVKLSMSLGKLVPIMCMECVPGDKVKLSCETLIRMAPMIAPVMHRLDATIHYFFVPNRILWPNWEKFITRPAFTGNDPVPEWPYLSFSDAVNGSYLRNGSLSDYLGVPQMGSALQSVSALPYAAYQRIFFEYYRDQNLSPLTDPITLTDGNNALQITDLCELRTRCWEHDYFTAALPWAQKGDAVGVPLGIDHNVPVFANDGHTGSSTVTASPSNLTIGADPDADVASDMYAQTQGLDASTNINELRRALRLQEWLEKNARAGTRYVENILAHFGVKSSDARLQRPEYITGVKNPVTISEVLNTTGEVDGLPQGNMAGHGVSVATGRYGSYFCEEHGFIIGIMSVMPKTAYQQGLPRKFSKFDALDYYWPSFAHLGEQEVLKKELYAPAANPNEVFGYVPRYAEYKFEPSRVAGEFKSTLNYWHFGRIFDTEPSLNNDFVTSDPATRPFAVTISENHQLFVHVLNKCIAIRPMPKFGTPMI